MNVVVTGLVHGAHLLQSRAQMQHVALILHSLFFSLVFKLFVCNSWCCHGIFGKGLKGQGGSINGLIVEGMRRKSILWGAERIFVGPSQRKQTFWIIILWLRNYFINWLFEFKWALTKIEVLYSVYQPNSKLTTWTNDFVIACFSASTSGNGHREAV